MEIKSKRQFYELYEKGFFGNKALEWNNPNEIGASGYLGMVCIRGFNIPRKYVRYNITQEELREIIEDYKKKEIPIERLRFNQSMPDEYLTIQGELYNSTEGLQLTYTTIKKPMNLALKEEEIRVRGLKAINILKYYFWPSSYSDIMVLMDKHPEAVVEFSSYSIPVGNIKGRNTVIWEVRNY